MHAIIFCYKYFEADTNNKVHFQAAFIIEILLKSTRQTTNVLRVKMRRPKTNVKRYQSAVINCISESNNSRKLPPLRIKREKFALS